MTTHPGLRNLRMLVEEYLEKGVPNDRTEMTLLSREELNQRIYNMGMVDGIRVSIGKLKPYLESDESYGDLMEANLEESSALGIVGWITRVLGVAAAEGSAIAAMAVAKLFEATDGDLRTVRSKRGE